MSGSSIDCVLGNYTSDVLIDMDERQFRKFITDARNAISSSFKATFGPTKINRSFNLPFPFLPLFRRNLMVRRHLKCVVFIPLLFRFD